MTSTPAQVSTKTPHTTFSVLFNFNDFDITIQSNDGVVFRLHRVNMKVHTGSLELAQAKSEEVVQLTENSATLELLFQFCYPARHPDLNDLAFDTLAELAEAAEKYKVFSAIILCKIGMRDALPLNAFDVLIYGTTYGHPDVYQKAAPFVVLQKPLSEVLPKLPASLITPWVLYYQQWRRIAEDGVSYYENWAKVYLRRQSYNGRYSNYCCPGCGNSCNNAEDTAIYVLRKLGAGLQCLTNLDKLFQACSYCNHPGIFESWRKSINKNIKNIQPLSAPPAQSSLIPSCDKLSEQSVSARFFALDSDVTFKSSDGILFRIHKVNLKVSAGGFAPPEFETYDEITCLTEPAKTLELLFQFCYPDYRPDVEQLEFNDLALLAEAAEKYEVYSAMNICNIFMRKHLPKDASDILAYAARHDYPDIHNIAAPILALDY